MTLTKILVPICFYCLKCTKFGQLILRKIIKIVATRFQILRLKCTKFDFRWGSAPDPARGAYSAPPDTLAGFKRPTSKGRGGQGRERKGREGRGKGVEREGQGREGRKGRAREGRGVQCVPYFSRCLLATLALNVLTSTNCN